MINLDRPEEAIRSAVFCGACQFHLLLLSLPGQVLLDHCSDLADNMYVFRKYSYKLYILITGSDKIKCSYQNSYSSKWYKAPMQIQKVLYVMQIRCRRFCSLTAGGLYEMNIENFGIVCINIIILYVRTMVYKNFWFYIKYRKNDILKNLSKYIV